MNNQHISMYQSCYGKETIDTNTYGKSTGHSGNYSTNYQNTGRELMTQDEVRMLENEKAILFIRGEKPIIDYKYDMLKHPNIKYTADGNGKIFEHGDTSRANTTLFKLEKFDTKDIKETEEVDKMDYVLLSEEEIEEYFLMEEYENERNKENNKQEKHS